jgi:type I restriction enzyme S subunit
MIIPDDKSIHLKISKLLFDIDLKIDINNKINAELESMAKTLYDYWFLQFEFPNENGKPYKSSGGKMVWNEELKREIPEGWEAIKLKNIVKKTNRVYDYNKDSKTYDLSIMPSNSISINDTSSSKDFETNLFAVKEGDILFGSIRPYLRKAGIASYDGAVAGTIHCYEVIKESNYNLALFTLTSENIFKYAINNSKGTKMPVITSDDLLEFMLPYNEEIAKKFNNIKIREIIIANIKQSNELASLRDFLLPLLMNGQVKFKDN